MSNVYMISDLHLGHKKILDFESTLRFGDSSLEHDHILITRIAHVCNSKKDILWILGDVCMDMERVDMLAEIPARKILVRGNHDQFDLGVYTKYFEKIYGIVSYRGYWISHAPIHPAELRGRKNIHGHVHRNSIMKSQYTQEKDDNYINVCVENCAGYPVNFQDIKNNIFKGAIK